MQNNYRFLLSILIPTKNRQEFAIETIKQILNSCDLDIQVVVQDNSDDNKLEEMLRPLMKDERIKYNYTSKILSFVDNFGLAVSQSDGEYVCIIGDDDGINYEILKILRWASKYKIDAIKPALNTVFIWPETGIINDKKANTGYMTISKVTSMARFANTKNEITKMLKKGCQNYLIFDLVKIYHGIVRKDKIEIVKDLTGKYFGGLSPDIYGAVSLSIVIPEVLCLDYPLTIAGVCRKSGSADSVTGKHTGEYEDAPHLRGHQSYDWADEVPKFYSVETIWADSALAALKDMGKNWMIKDFKEEVLIAYCIYKYSKYSNLLKNHYYKRIKKNEFSKFKAFINLYKSLVTGPFYDFIIRGYNKIIRKKSDVIKIYDVKNIIQSHDILIKYLNSNNITVEKVISNATKEIDKKANTV